MYRFMLFLGKTVVQLLSPTLVQPHRLACWALLSMGFSMQEHWSRLPFTPPGGHLDLGTELASLPLLHCRRILHAETPGKP